MGSEELKTALTVAALLTFTSQLVLSTALNSLWTLMNTLQIVVYLSLLRISFPYNVFSFNKLLGGLATFDIYPTDFVYESFLPEAKGEPEKRFEIAGIESNDFLLNSGILFWFMAIWFVLAILIGIL